MRLFAPAAAAALLAALAAPASADVIGERYCGCHRYDLAVCRDWPHCFNPCVEDVYPCYPRPHHPCEEYRLDCAPRYRAQ
jgi:hypothetical protein